MRKYARNADMYMSMVIITSITTTMNADAVTITRNTSITMIMSADVATIMRNTSITMTMSADAVTIIITIIMQMRCLQAGAARPLRNIPEKILKRSWRLFQDQRSTV